MNEAISRDELCKELFDIHAVKFGSFQLVSGTMSPIYLDLRMLVSHPHVLKHVAAQLERMAEKLAFDRVAAIPYTAIPIGTALSLQTGWPLIFLRKQPKDYGTKSQIVGDFHVGETVAVVDDLVTTGLSKFESIEKFEKSGLVVRDVIVLIDREQGGKEELRKRGYALHTMLTISEIVETLHREGLVSDELLSDVKRFLKNPGEWGK